MNWTNEPSTNPGANNLHAGSINEDKQPYHRPHDRQVELPIGLESDEIILKPSLRTLRRNFTIACTLFTLGALGLVLSSPWDKEFLSPGPLSSHHAPLAIGESGNRCAACHAQADGSLVSWIKSVFQTGQKNGLSQSELCMQCHDATLNSQHPLNPHSISPTLLAERPPSARTFLTSGRSLVKPPLDQHQQIPCSACHQEHHGGHQLSALTDSQCQACHGRVFHSFEQGHPEFADYPLKRRSRIAFDHVSHFTAHFPEKGETFSCATCHWDDAQKNVKRLAPFSQSCAACHHDQIMDSSSSGLALIALPQLDMQAIEAAGLQVGSWPLAATGDFDGPLPPIMKLMLFDDPAAKEILQRRGSTFEFFDLNADHPTDVADAVELAWAIKRLMAELATNGPFAIQQKIQSVLQMEISNSQLSRMITTLDGAVFRVSVQVWLPNLAAELQAVGWKKLEPSSPAEEISFSWQTGSLNQELVQLVHNLGPHPPCAASFPALTDPPLPSITSDDEWLAENPLAHLLGKQTRANPAAATGEGFTQSQHQPTDQATKPAADMTTLGIDSITDRQLHLPHPHRLDSAPAGSLLRQQPVDRGEPPLEDPIRDFAMSFLKNPDHQTNQALFNALVRSSGWYRNDQTMQIVYRPTGHADDLIKSWIDFVTQIPQVEDRLETIPLYQQLISHDGIGQCRSCHAVDRDQNQTLTMNWVAEYRNPAIRSFTRFSHAPHLIQPQLKDCSHCHQLDSDRTNDDSFAHFNQQTFQSNFRPMSKQDCISCHQQGVTDNRCTICHSYHVGSQIR